MPELPEVETTLKGVAPHLQGQCVAEVVVRNHSLRWPIPHELQRELAGQMFTRLQRRAKYLLFETDAGCLMVHLGMSGRLRIVAEGTPVEKHDHVDVVLASGKVLRYTDPRRFGCMLWVTDDLFQHPLLSKLGPEPLSQEFSGDYLYAKSRGRKVPVKQFLMDGQVVVGVGNIYANESLFACGIHPATACGKISGQRYMKLCEEVKQVIQKAIQQGGTTLRDFVNGEGKPGYFQQELKVYGRGGQPCYQCQTTLKEIRQGQRSTVYCPRCQR